MTTISAPPEKVAASTPAGESSSDGSALTRELEVVLPSVLASSAQQDLPAITRGVDAGDGSEGLSRESIAGAVVGIAAALGVVGAAPLARALMKRGLSRVGLPEWLRPKVDASVKPRVLTLTAFYDQRARLVKDVEAGQPVVLTRHGVAIAAVVPLERGVFEQVTLERFLAGDASGGEPVDELTDDSPAAAVRVPEQRQSPERSRIVDLT